VDLAHPHVSDLFFVHDPLPPSQRVERQRELSRESRPERMRRLGLEAQKRYRARHRLLPTWETHADAAPARPRGGRGGRRALTAACLRQLHAPVVGEMAILGMNESSFEERRKNLAIEPVPTAASQEENWQGVGLTPPLATDLFFVHDLLPPSQRAERQRELSESRPERNRRLGIEAQKRYRARKRLELFRRRQLLQ